MEGANSDKAETKFKKDEMLNATAFGKLIDCSVQAVKKFFKEGKMTEGVSYLKDGNTILIDVGAAKMELRATIKPSTCKNPKLLEFLDLPNVSSSILEGFDKALDGKSAQQVREELNKSELRISWMNEQALAGKFIERVTVEKNLESMGIEVRNAFTGIAARLSSAVRAAATDRDAENIIHSGIEEVLSKLADITKRDVAVKK